MFPIIVTFSILFIEASLSEIHRGGILYPRESETRQVVTLDGLWNFAVPNTSNPLTGFEYHWYKKDLKESQHSKIYQMPVPASYNDIPTDWEIRDHVGLVWYDRLFYAPKAWSINSRVWLRFGSVSYAAQVWINGQIVMSHEIGHLPFSADVTKFLKFGKENRVTVACDNTLLSDTIPQGSVSQLDTGRLLQSYTFDFFNYAGIDRPVHLYTTPDTYIDDISVLTVDLQESGAILDYNISIVGDTNPKSCRVSLIDKNKKLAASAENYDDLYGSLTIENPTLWWPYLMSPTPGYMYTFQVELLNENGELLDKYSLPVGLRILSWDNTTLYINKQPVYLHGFGKHEDSDIRGKGLDLPLLIRDFNLIKWVGANAFRTSHYPYAEEIMDLADETGIMVIDECPAVNIELFSETLLAKHKISLSELIRRDKNRPSVIIWSAANEPRTQYPQAKEYFRLCGVAAQIIKKRYDFSTIKLQTIYRIMLSYYRKKQVIEHIKSLDDSRPTTIVEAQSSQIVESSRFVDIISFNRYNGWYSNPGNLDVISGLVMKEAELWHKKFNKPIIMQEYGGDTLEGLHFEPAYIWSEEYQVSLISEHFKAFDQLRNQGYFIGEFIWNFADFKTAQTYTRVGGNKKGIFTRSRQPKASARHIRKRYWGLANEYAKVSLPDDLNTYTIAETSTHDEL